MKKFVIILTILLFSLAAWTQDKTGTIYNNLTRYDFPMTAADTISNNDTIFWVKVVYDGTYPLTQDLEITLDSVSGTPAMAIQLYGRKFDDLTWSTIGSAVNWGATSGDTTIVISNATANRYRQFKIGFDGDGSAANKALITGIDFKAWIE